MAINFRYFAKESTSSMRRNMALTIAAVMVTGIALIILGSVSMLVHAGNGIAASMKERVDEIRVFLREDITNEELESLQRYIVGMDEVEDAQYMSKEDALEEFKEMFADQPEMLEQIEGNPLPAEFRVRMKDPKYNETVAKRLADRPEISVDDNGEKEIKNPTDVVNRVLRLTGWVQKAGIAVVAVFAIVAVALVAITIRMAIYSRRKEIGIMKLVGATNWFIRWPFIMEGIIEGFMGALLGILVAVLFKTSLITKLEAAFENIKLVSGGYIALLAFLLIIIGMLIGALGSAFALRRYIEV
ncbi:MAG: ABC transporter permease [Actinobacteria bacterium]|nr:ABC transporter permease [Actinomycetota bacterium]